MRVIRRYGIDICIENLLGLSIFQCKTNLVSYERTHVMSKSHTLVFRSLKLETTTDCGHAALPSYYCGCRLISICFCYYPSKPNPTTPLIPRFWRSATCNEPIVEVHGQGGKCPKGNLAWGHSKGEGCQNGFGRRPLLVWYVFFSDQIIRMDCSVPPNSSSIWCNKTVSLWVEATTPPRATWKS